jgi:serine/threonine-protein kinase
MEHPKQLGRYEIVRVLGTGAMGIVYEGLDSKLHRKVAIKTILKNASIGEDEAADYSVRFMREAQAVANLNHPNIVSVYDFGEEGEVAYFVMEYIRGSELKEHMNNGVQFNQQTYLRIMVELLDALDYAHQHEIVHRDVKPANIMIEESGRVKLTDFGVVKVVDNQEGTQSGTIVGTPGYMSPEQILGVAVSPRSDIFAAGVILYQFLTNQKPFVGNSVFAVQHQIVSVDPAPPSTINPDISPILDDICRKAIAKKPEDRYSRASEFADALRVLLSANTAPASTSPILVGGQQPSSTPAAPSAIGGAVDAAAKNEITMTAIGSAARDDFEKMLDKRAQLESLMEEKFTRVLTVMFTDLKGSTTIAETEGDMVGRMLIKHQNDILLPAIKDNSGVFIKSIGDGTLSYFERAQDAVRAAVRIQRGMDELNMSKKFRTPVLMRIGMHTGKCIVEKNDIAGDVVNTASRFESAASAGEIYLSEATYDAMTDKAEIYCRYVKKVELKGKKELYSAYKAFWNPTEIELDKQPVAPKVEAKVASGGTPKWKLALMVVVPLAIILAITLSTKIAAFLGIGEQHRSIEHSISVPSDGK